MGDFHFATIIYCSGRKNSVGCPSLVLQMPLPGVGYAHFTGEKWRYRERLKDLQSVPPEIKHRFPFATVANESPLVLVTNQGRKDIFFPLGTVGSNRSFEDCIFIFAWKLCDFALNNIFNLFLWEWSIFQGNEEKRRDIKWELCDFSLSGHSHCALIRVCRTGLSYLQEVTVRHTCSDWHLDSA